MKEKQKKLDTIFLEMCCSLSKLSHCVSHKVACLIVKDNRIISSGINGTASGLKNCDEIFNPDNFDRMHHHEFSSKNEIHSEMNAIIEAAKNGISINNSTAYCTLEPCFECSKNLSVSGIKRIVYKFSYDFNKDHQKERNEYLEKLNVKLEKLDES